MQTKNIKAKEIKAKNIKDRDVKTTEIKDRDVKTTEIKDRDAKTKEIKDRNITQGSTWKHIYKIATPATTIYLFTILYHWVDSYWAGKLGVSALATLGLTFPILLFTIAIVQGMSAGGITMLSHALGEEHKDKTTQILSLAIVLGIILSVVMLIFSEQLMILLGTDELTLSLAIAYMHTWAWGIPFLFVFFALNIVLLAQGNTTFIRNMLIINFFINLGLDPLLMHGVSIRNITIIPSLGIQGIALATVLVYMCGVILIWIKMQKNGVMQRKVKAHKKFDISSYIQIITHGFPTFLEIALVALGIGIANYFLSRIGVIGVDGGDYAFSSFHTGGPHALAGYGLGLRIEQLLLVPSLGVGVALTTLAREHYNEKNYMQIHRILVKGNIICIGIWIVVIVSVLLLGNQVARIFTDDARVIQVTFFYLFYASAAFMGYALMENASSIIHGMQSTWASRILLALLFTRHALLPLILIPMLAYEFKKGIYGVFGTLVIGAWASALILTITLMILLKKKHKDSIQQV